MKGINIKDGDVIQVEVNKKEKYIKFQKKDNSMYYKMNIDVNSETLYHPCVLLCCPSK